MALLIVGHNDVTDVSLTNYFRARGEKVVSAYETGLNVLDRSAVERFFADYMPSRVILTSVRSGGIAVNQAKPAEFIFENLQAQNNIIDVSFRSGVKKFLYLAASCIYPRECPQPMKETYFQTGRMELTSEPYSMAKSAGVVMCQAYRRQYGFPAIIGVPATVYGSGGHENPADMHVMGAMAVKFRDAVAAKAQSVTFWGSGEPRREFIFGMDLADACRHLLENYDSEEMVNIGAGEDISIRELAALLKDVSGFAGDVLWDRSKPDGTPRKLLDSSRIFATGWKPRTALRDGVAAFFSS